MIMQRNKIELYDISQTRRTTERSSNSVILSYNHAFTQLHSYQTLQTKTSSNHLKPTVIHHFHMNASYYETFNITFSRLVISAQLALVQCMGGAGKKFGDGASWHLAPAYARVGDGVFWLTEPMGASTMLRLLSASQLLARLLGECLFEFGPWIAADRPFICPWLGLLWRPLLLLLERLTFIVFSATVTEFKSLLSSGHISLLAWYLLR